MASDFMKFHIRFQVSGVGHKRVRCDNQEFDPLEKEIGAQSCSASAALVGGQEIILIREFIFQCSDLSSWAFTPDPPSVENLTPDTRESEQQRDHI